jgi:hypothetical protein
MALESIENKSRPRSKWHYVVAAVADFFAGRLLLYNGGSLLLLLFYCLRERHRCAFVKFLCR